MLATASIPTLTMSNASTTAHDDERADEIAAETTTNTADNNKGVAGRINYAAWDKVASKLVESLEHEDEQEKQEEAAKVRMDEVDRRKVAYRGLRHINVEKNC